METQIILPIEQASETLRISDLDKLHDAAKRYGALVIIAGSLQYVNVEAFKAGVQKELATKSLRASERAASKGEKGRSIGLLRARIKRAPELISNKKKALETAKKAAANAATAYDRYIAKRKLADIEDGLARLESSLENDLAELNKILHEVPEE